jgi:hypothetical protein
MATSNIRFQNGEEPIVGVSGRTVGDFWRWAYSDLLSNRNRSILAEYIVGSALNAVDRPRVEWDSSDLRYRGFRVEVKSAGYSQSWHQKGPSRIQYSIRKAMVWNSDTGEYEGTPKRCADIYVFCLHAEKEKCKAEVLDMTAWEFYVVPTCILDSEFAEQKTVMLATVKRLVASCRFSGLKATVDEALAVYPTSPPST